MIQNTFPCFAMSCTTLTIGSSVAFTVIPAQKNQCGLALWIGTTGLEVGGAGVSYGPAGGFTLANGVTTALNFMNSNGSSLQLVTNGSGLPIFNTILAPISFAGAPQLWLTTNGTTLQPRITFFLNDPAGNQ